MQIKAQQESAETLGQEAAKELIEIYMHEKNKRAHFTYNAGATARASKAETSPLMAKRFIE